VAELQNQKSPSGSDLALAGNRFVHDDIEGRQAVGGERSELVVADGVVVADLAVTEQRQGRMEDLYRLLMHGFVKQKPAKEEILVRRLKAVNPEGLARQLT
jgi:hypothetical protein